MSAPRAARGPAPRGRCSVCGDEVALRVTGAVRVHNNLERWIMGATAKEVCEGSGQQPLKPGARPADKTV